MAQETPNLPIRISKVTDRYLLFDIDDVMYLRRHHNICSPFVGTMPQAPSQSVFMSLPIELMGEEAKVLVEKKVAYIVDDSTFHHTRIASLDQSSRAAYLQAIRRDGMRAATAARELSEFKRAQAQSQGKGKGKGKKNKEKSKPNPSVADQGTATNAGDPVVPIPSVAAREETSLFDTPTTKSSTKPKDFTPAPPEAWAVTPSTSGALLTTPPTEDGGHERTDDLIAASASLIDVPNGYPLYAHLHDNGYFMMPGLRFGCDYNVYPGDPLRFHSHFQATHFGWTEPVNLLDLVTGGRLGTNVKKAYLVGGEVPAGGSGNSSSNNSSRGPGEGEGKGATAGSIAPPVRAFSIEWAAM
jgi:tRNA-splicing endonuclease subunit Sen34